MHLHQDFRHGMMKNNAILESFMPDPNKLSTASGQLGPICAITGKALRFSEAIVLDNEYVCWEAYIETTGASPSSEGKEVGGLKLE
jgi:hypothetical protein|tara:strand:+ start:236 stop:493 length:258 start_codon:yes stop_codon:yes gene_type:complete